jgi:hypothetical protein
VTTALHLTNVQVPAQSLLALPPPLQMDVSAQAPLNATQAIVLPQTLVNHRVLKPYSQVPTQ